jgi:serine phosphatase RsbU (regulator of sigma subunit)
MDFNKRYDLEARIRDARKAGREEVIPHLEKNRHRAGILLADVSGHRFTDAMLAAMLHQAFLLGVLYELDCYGNVTPRLIENINSRFYQSSSVGKFLTLIYGEINSDGTFHFISAAHPNPVVFSHEYDRIIDIDEEQLLTYPPIGTMPSREDVDARAGQSLLGAKENYRTNKLSLMGTGDIMLLFTDGFAEHENDRHETYFQDKLETKLRQIKMLSARDIYHALLTDMMAFAPPQDDISLIVIKKTA